MIDMADQFVNQILDIIRTTTCHNTGPNGIIMLLKLILLTLTLWLAGLLCNAGCDAKPHLLAATTTPVGYATPGGTPWLTQAAAAVAVPVASVGAAYYPAYASYTYTPVYYGSYAAYPTYSYYPYFRR